MGVDPFIPAVVERLTTTLTTITGLIGGLVFITIVIFGTTIYINGKTKNCDNLVEKVNSAFMDILNNPVPEVTNLFCEPLRRNLNTARVSCPDHTFPRFELLEACQSARP